MSSKPDGNGGTIYACHSWESVFALTETFIREWFAWRPLIPVQIWIPVLRTPQGIPIFSSPYIFAIAFDATSVGVTTGTTPLTFSHTCTGSNLMLSVGVGLRASTSPVINTPTYNSVSMSLVGSQQLNNVIKVALYFQTGPTTGSNTVSCGFSGGGQDCNAAAVSYSGVNQSGQPDASNGSTGAANATVTVTTVADQCWVVALCGSAASTISGPNNTNRGGVLVLTGVATIEYQDTNAAVSAGAGTVMSWSSATTWSEVAGSFSPFGAVAIKVSPLSILGAG